jgi:hypothetical protein
LVLVFFLFLLIDLLQLIDLLVICSVLLFNWRGELNWISFFVVSGNCCAV